MKFIALAIALCSLACSSRPSSVLPARQGPPPVAALTLVWVGEARAERRAGEAWVRAEAFDYEFTVEQRRYRDYWESVKHLRRRHPAYDGSAGPREQTMYFRLALSKPSSEGSVALTIDSSLGLGTGTSDREFRSARLVMHPEISRFAPFDTYRIVQRYAYEEGKLTETVSLDKGERPWVRNLETATLFAAHRFAEAPTTR